MRLNHTVPPGNGIQHLGHPVADVLPHKITHKKRSKTYPDKRIDKKQQTPAVYLKAFGKKHMGGVHHVFQQDSRQPRHDSHQQAQYQDKILFLYILHPPNQEASEPTTFVAFSHNLMIQKTSTATELTHSLINTFYRTIFRIKFQLQTFSADYIRWKFLNHAQLGNNTTETL